MTSTFATFKRLLTTFAAPYWKRMTVGVVAGLLVGGSLFGLLKVAADVLDVVDSSSRQANMVAAQPGSGDRLDPYERLGPLGRLARAYDLPLTRDDGAVTWQFTLVASFGILVLALIRGAGLFLNHYHLRWVGCRVVMDLRNALFSTLQRQSLKFYGQSDVGELISRCTYDTSLIEAAIAGTVADICRAPVEIFAVACFIALMALEHRLAGLTAVLFLVFPLCICPIVVLGRYVKRHARRALDRISHLVSRMQENFTGIRVVKAYNMEAAESARFGELNDSYFESLIKALRAEIMMTPLMEFVAVVCACLLLVMCHAKGVTLAQILPMGVAAMVAYRPLKQLAKINVGIQRSVAAAERLFAILDTDTSLPEAPNPVRVSEFTDRIAFEHVDFAYGEGSPQILTDIAFEIPKGSVVAFVGETGSGKTTVANLLARFYDPSAGRVLLDGHDLRDLDVASLRRLIGIVTQETILFNDTIANNIRYGTPDAPEEAIEEAARKANAHEFIMAEPQGYERVVGEKGFVLSGGQRQRVAIARAILKNPPILILDEATSALDTATEQLVQEAINRVMHDRTVFAIAHRLSTIKHANQILVLDKGRAVERGTHAQLYEAGGTYRGLCDMQFSLGNGRPA